MGKLTLDRNPGNYFADVEQLAFDPAHMPPGIEPSPDKMLQGRLFAYGDTHRHRLGPNHLQLPVNCPYKVHDDFHSSKYRDDLCPTHVNRNPSIASTRLQEQTNKATEISSEAFL